MKRIFLLSLWPFLFLLHLNGQSFRLVSWNIQYMGKTKSEGEMAFMAELLKEADMVAVQEVVAGPGGAQAVARLADALNRTGARWDYQLSEPTTQTSGHISERYAFLYKTGRIKAIGRAYLEPGLSYSVPREPFTGRFAFGRDTFRLINFHARPHDQNPERGIREVLPMARKYAREKVIFAGDWNVEEGHPIFRDFRNRGYRPALHRTRTTLRRKVNTDGVYFGHAIDNIWYHLEDFILREAGIIDLVRATGSLQTARALSDHVPVVAEFSRVE